MKNNNENEPQAFYGVVKVSQNGQVIIPADLRKDLNIKHGDQLVAFRSQETDDIVFVKMEKMQKILNDYGLSGLKGISKSTGT